MLPGFEYPVYTCITPQTKWTFDVRCLTVSEQDRLLQSSTFGYSLINNINEVIWKTVVNKPDHIKTYEDFLKNVTVKDREALMYSILQASDADEQVFDITCPRCGNQESIQVRLSECFSATIWDGEPGEILNVKEKVSVEIGKYNVEFTLIVPTLYREKRIYMYLGNKQISPILLPLLYSIELVEFKNKDTNSLEMKAETLTDIESCIRGLPGKTVKRIRNKLIDTFGKYTMDLRYKYICSSCGFETMQDVDLLGALFRTIAE